MKNLKFYESMGKKWNDVNEENLDILRDYLQNEKFRNDFNRAFLDKKMDVDIVSEPLSDSEFIVEWWPKYDNVVPNEISYYLDEIAKILSGLFGVKNVTWRFEAWKGVSRVIFNLNEPINKNMVRFKNMLM